MSGDAALADFAERLRSLKTFAHEVAKEAAPLVEEAVKATADAGTTIEGKAWPSKRDGARALPKVASAISAAAKGVAVVVTLTGAYVFHHYAKGKDQRRILPDSGAGVSPRVAEALRTATRRAFARLMDQR